MLSISLTLCVLLLYGVSGIEVKEGGSVTLHTNVKINQKDIIKWFFQDTRIAQVIGNISSCTDVQCNEGTERFRDRLKLDNQTGSLTISDIQPADSGVYELQITSSISNTDILKIFNVTVSVSGAEVFLKEGDSVTLYTGVQTNQQDRVKWYFYNTQIAHINGDLSKSCTDVQCKDGDERFRDRLKLDHQTGSLTITNTTNTHSGEYQLQIFGSRNIEKTFSLEVDGVAAAERDEVKTVKQGESVTLPVVIKKTNDVVMWYFNDIRIAESSGDQSQICTDDQCKERFRDRLKLDHQTGSLTITHTTNTHSGEYKLQINNSRFSITKIFSVFANDSHEETPLHLRSGVRIIEICSYVFLALLVVTLAACLFYCLYRNRNQNRQKYRMGIDLKIEGQSVFLHTGIKIQKGDHVKWMFGDKNFLIAEITEETQKRREFNLYDDAADENFLDRLELNKKTGSLIIRNSRDTDSGEYKLRITRNGKSSTKRFSVTVSCSSEPIVILSDQIEFPEIKVQPLQYV